ncbi:Exo_endo_phos domain-containing protein [Gossypium australe]|uniref:Exo_endo_phos domain-containing protein n=1 Tax=Gossypium australe TaxID=47621 RepID=A0A5B6WJ14_9ROSI|nr:Exo_endo_phos domain-containing protein [Gossypium australe]
MYSFEKSRGQPKEEKRMEAFREVLKECQLTDVGYTGETNIKERLDRGVANEKWMHLFPKGNIHQLIHLTSDHCPLFISTNNEKKVIRGFQDLNLRHGGPWRSRVNEKLRNHGRHQMDRSLKNLKDCKLV